MTNLKPNFESEKESLNNLYPDLVSGIEKKQVKKENDLIKKKSNNTGKVLEKKSLDITRTIPHNTAQFNPVKAGIKLPNSGAKKGQKYKKTILKEEARERYINTINQFQDKLIVAQSQLAFGSMTFFAKVPYEDPETGKQKTRLEVIEDNQLIIDILSNEDLMQNQDYFVVKKTDPNIQAINYMLDQSIDKAISKMEMNIKSISAKDVIDEFLK